MSSELTNLLPPDRDRGLTRDYFFRLAAVAAFMLAFIALAHDALLLPSYIYVAQEREAKEVRLAELDAALASSEEKAVGERRADLAKDAQALLALLGAPSASASVRAVLQVPRTGITLTSIAAAPVPPQKMTIIGTAATRDSLRRYYLAISSLPKVENADLPLSAYAKETNIPFTITLTGLPTP